MAIGGVSPEMVAIPELGVTPLVDPDTDLEAELPTPGNLCYLVIPAWRGSVFRKFVPRLRILSNWKLDKALFSVSVLPVMVTPIVEPVEAFPVAFLPVLPDDDPGATLQVSPLRVAATARSWMCSRRT